ncbi:hypothetical protein HWI79_2229 [Cryptosporidium felis]|nr:hypothetical protein HWI79_2229 [Cryptosporidium felis]
MDCSNSFVTGLEIKCFSPETLQPFMKCDFKSITEIENAQTLFQEASTKISGISESRTKTRSANSSISKLLTLQDLDAGYE